MFKISTEQLIHRSLLSSYTFIPDSDCYRLVRLLDDEGTRLLPHDRALLYRTLLQLTSTGMPGWYCSPDFADGSRLTLDLSVAGQITVTAYRDGMASDRRIVTPVHPAWIFLNNRTELLHLLQEWQTWAATPAPGEQREEALRRLTDCIVRGETKLNLNNLGLTSLPDLPDSLVELEVQENQLTSLPDLPPSLTRLDADNNQLTCLPDLPPSLPWLSAGGNQLTSLPPLPVSLRKLYVQNNQLTVLPELPSSLTRLHAWLNQLTSLPNLPAGLTSLHVANNQLTSLPVLPNSLTSLYIASNRLTSLPPLPASLKGRNVGFTMQENVGIIVY